MSSVDRYKYDQVGVSEKMTILNGYIDEYKNKIVEITNLVKEIESSSSWIDNAVKTEYINKCNGYIEGFNQCIMLLNSYMKHLGNKSSNCVAIENKGVKMMKNE